MRATILAVPALLALAACSSSEEPGTLSQDEQGQLNDAAEMLDANSVALETVEEANAAGAAR